MGQQQLLLLVLGAIIVGLAIVVGINLFGQGAVKANEDACRQDILNMMARVEEFYRKPEMLGGGGKDLTLLTGFHNLGYRLNADGSAATLTTYINENGEFTLTVGNPTTIEAKLAENQNLTVKYSIAPHATQNNTLVVTDISPENAAS